jgi:formylglycine-generating enzyme required for sulfatase activity
MNLPQRLLLILAAGALSLAYAADDRVPAAQPAKDKRVALVIGNAAYGTSPLKNPVNDARAIAAKLQKLGFDVVKRENLTTRQIGSTLREFRSKLGPGAEALFFYAGHGLQVKGVNYLPAVDADITSEEDVPNQSINVSQLLEIMDDTKTRLNLIFLDACRNNPFTRRFRSAGGGLAKIEAPSGTKISFATRPGSVAADGEGSNGLYTEHLLRVMDERGMPIEQALKKVYSGVKKASKGAQEPWEEGTIEGEFYFQAGSGVQVKQVENPSSPLPGARSAAQIEDELWDSIKEAREAAVFEEYLRHYPKGRYLAQARVKLAGMKAEMTKAAGEHLPGKVFKDCAECPEMVVIPAGSFKMGSKVIVGADQHVVRIGRPFALGRTEVTQRQWRDVMGSNPSRFTSCGDDCPVERVTWNTIQEFVRKLNQKTGKAYRLPSEAEWEYACRAGGTHTYCGGDGVDKVAWHEKNSESKTHPGGSKAANAWGLHDMSGNVWEWVADCANATYKAAPNDGGAWTEGDCTSRARRGGAWDQDPMFARADFRSFSGTGGFAGDNLGFRLARTLP